MNTYVDVKAFPTLFGRPGGLFRKAAEDSTFSSPARTSAGWPRILLVAAPEDPEWEDPVVWMLSQQAHVVRAPNRQFPRDWLSSYPDDFDLMIVDCEYVGNFGDVVDYVLSLRQRSPDTPVILASRYFKRNEFGSDSSTILDSALRMPFTRSNLFLAICSAHDNGGRRLRFG